MGQSFDTIDSMVTAMSTRLAKLLNMTFKDYLTENGYHDSFIKEYAAAALNCNYGQSVEVYLLIITTCKLPSNPICSLIIMWEWQWRDRARFTPQKLRGQEDVPLYQFD